MYGDTAILQNFNNVEMYKLIFLKFEIFSTEIPRPDTNEAESYHWVRPTQ